jgi:stage III sporulation protein AG
LRGGENVEKNEKSKLILILVCVAVGIVMIALGSISANETEDSYEVFSSFENKDPSEYASFVEAKVKEICSGVSGVGDVFVVVTLEGGYRTVYALNSQSTQSGYKSEIVLTGSGSSEKALVVGYEYPKISGIGIVAEGGNSSVVKQKIITLVSAAFDISTNKIEVVGG